MKTSVATGYIVLLKGGSAESKAPGLENDENLPLAFMSLTSGNVVDACFGVENPSLKDDTPSRRSAKIAKGLLSELDESDSFRKIAVGAYCEAFEAVMDHNKQMDRLNCFTRCFRSKKIRKGTEIKIKAAFASLEMTVRGSC